MVMNICFELAGRGSRIGMNRKTLSTSFCIVTLSSALLGILFITLVKAQTTPTVSVIFPNTTNSSVNEYEVCDTFRVNITVNSPDIGIWSWQVGIYFDKNILECVNLGEGTFFAGKYILGFQPGTINNTSGYITFSGNSLRDPETVGVNGTGVLMWFEFHVIGCGNCVLNITESPLDLQCGVKLNQRVDSSLVRIEPVIVIDGSFTNTESVEIPIPSGGNATIEGNVTITKSVVTKNALHFDVSGPSGSTGWINITFPMVNTTEIKVFINKVKLTPPPFPIITANATCYFIYFEFSLSAHEIAIQFAIADVAVTDVVTSKTVVNQGYCMNITLTVENQGDFTETFNITALCDETAISLLSGKNYTTVTLKSGTLATVTINWNTTGIAKGNFTITACVNLVPGETDTADNNLTNGWIIVAMIGDITGPDGWPDGECDMRDVGLVARYFGQDVPLAPANCDLTGPTTGVPDGEIDMRDIGLVARHFGEVDP